MSPFDKLRAKTTINIFVETRHGTSLLTYMNNIKIKSPLISVIMPVYNTAEFLASAIESILSQTYKNFEFIIVDDASSDNSWKTIRSYAKADKRIRIYRNPINLGVSLTANIATAHAKGKYLARMDSDDISSPDRLQKQLNYFKKHPRAILVGGQCTIINESDNIIGYKKFPLSPHQALMDMLFWAVPVQQGFMMINLQKLPSNFTWYEASKRSAEEIDLFFKLSQYGEFANLPDNLYYYRQIPNSLSHFNPKKTFWLTLQSRLLAIKNGHQPSVKGWLFNFAQIFFVSVLPTSVIYNIWYLFRGVSQLKLRLVPVSLASAKA
jgi:glycosyltransferase involved in cell wall biosynthesis